MASPLIEWLLDSDPAIAWQVERDLLSVPEARWQATRARVATEGFGARLLALQDPDGQWDGGAYLPSGFEFGGAEPGQPWTATTWSLNTLREWGVDSAALAGTADLLEANSRWEYEDLPYWGGEVDCCINGFTLANGSWLGAEVSGLLDWFAEHRMTDGGWNCMWEEGSTHSSFHSTLNSLKGLLSFQISTGQSTADLRQPAEEYLLERRLFRRKSTGEVIGPWALHFAHPARWVYSVLVAADYFRTAAIHEGVLPDPRMADAIEEIRHQRQADGSWIQGEAPAGRQWFDVDVPAGVPSKWLTLSGTRVLDWWDGAAGSEEP